MQLAVNHFDFKQRDNNGLFHDHDCYLINLNFTFEI